MSNVVSDLRTPLVEGDKSYGDVTSDIARLVGRKPGAGWWVAFLISATAAAVGFGAIAWEIARGIGEWGLNRTVGWGFDITNFVFWVGIGHAGTLISAVLFLMRQRWRTSINRAAEAMTIFAVMCAALFPLIHMGRPWYFFWIIPYPNNRGSLWVNFRSPLLWDFFAISTYFIISLIFWYLGMIPDLATLRDRARSRVSRAIFGFLSQGWNGSARAWHKYETIYALLALLATPLVVSVHSIVSFDFATSVVPGWHSTIFPPFFVIGAVFSGFAMVLALLLITRRVMNLEAYITPHHLDWMCKIILLTSLIMGASYGIEIFAAWYSASPYEIGQFVDRATGVYAFAFWTMIFCNAVAPQIFWFRKARHSVPVMAVVCVLVVIGMWFERFVIIVVSLHHEYLPSMWTNYAPTLNEIAILVGMFGFFFALFLLFVRGLPVIAIAEIKGVLGYARPNKALERIFTGGRARGAARPSASPPAQHRREREQPFSIDRYIVAYFRDEHDLLAAATEARRRGRRVVDAFAPFPVHGISDTLNLRSSRLAWIGAWAGFLGLAGGLALQVWVSAYDWPIRVGGQPFNSWPVFLPVTFELTVLFAGIIGVVALFWSTGLWPGNKAPRLEGTTDDRFALALLLDDASVDPATVKEMLREAGATRVAEGDELT